MTDTFRCDDKAQLVAYLYDDIDEATRRLAEDHLRRCPACADELAALGRVRHELAGWSPPEVSLGFTIVPATEAPPAPVVHPARWWRAAADTTWARAAAAVLVVSAGLSLLNLQIRYDRDGLVISTGWLTRPTAAPAATAPPATAARAPEAAAPWRQELAALEQTLRAELDQARTTLPATSPAGRDLSAERVAALIEQSERRQKQELALRIAQLGRDLEVQRRSDLVRINQGLGQVEGRAGAEILRQRQMLDYIMRVSAPPPQ